MSRHIVFGTGQIGRLVAEKLVSLGADVTPVNRTGRDTVSGTRVVAGDATDPAFTARVCAGADAVYQFSEHWVVDDAAFRSAFVAHATPLDEALATTIQWYGAAGFVTRAPASPIAKPSSAA